MNSPARCGWARTELGIPYHDTEWGDLLARGFRFVGSTICYAFTQAVGMVNDHTTEGFRYRELGG